MRKLLKFSTLTLVFGLCLNLSFGGMVNALTAEKTNDLRFQQQKLEETKAAKYWKSNPLSETQKQELIKDLSKDKLKEASSKLNKHKDGIQSVKLSDNFILEVNRFSSNDKKSNINLFNNVNADTYDKQVWSTWDINSSVGIHIFSFTLYGEFYYDGYSCRAVSAEATASTSYPGWSKDSSSSSYYNATSHGRWTFKDYVGIAPVGMVIETLDFTANIDMDADGNYSSYAWQ